MIMKTRMIIALLAVTTLVVSTAHSDVSELRAGGQLAVDDLHAQWTAAPARMAMARQIVFFIIANLRCTSCGRGAASAV